MYNILSVTEKFVCRIFFAKSTELRMVELNYSVDLAYLRQYTAYLDLVIDVGRLRNSSTSCESRAAVLL